MDNRSRSWKAAALGIIAAVMIVILATAAGYGATTLFNSWNRMQEPRAFGAGVFEALMTARVATSLFAFQAVTVALVVAANAWLRRTGEAPILNFSMPRGGIRTMVLAVAALIAIATCFASLVFVFDPDALRHDLEPFSEMMRSRTWWLILLAAGVGAPLAEEFLFRGLLFGALRRSPLGFIGATLITAGSWALLHANYSVYGLGVIMLIGLYLAWLRERTGSLLTPIVCHSFYNSMIIFLMAFAPGNLASG